MSEIAEQVGRLIRDTRKRKGLTQKELGQRLGVTESAINKYESGKENPTAQTLQKVAESLGVKLEITFKEE